MELSPDETIFWEYGFITINLTLVTTWAIMLLLVITSFLITRKLKSSIQISRWQYALEIIVLGISNQIKEVGIKEPKKYIGFIGTLFLFILVSNFLIIIPWYSPPTGSLSTTGALAVSVLLAVPFFGISESGLLAYLKTYLSPTVIMLPFNIISEISRTLALTVRLFGNIMSGGMIVAVLLSVAPFFFPVIMTALGLLTGVVQAYIFSVLATVYIAAAVSDKKSKNNNKQLEEI
ncbi:F0F1 ATP synthase subunit A [Algoriphagus sp. SE2]|uniref:F0F1 ATP synthase subunit A n=1 Tax=Algoriphagus sp. SE2 TaxID=3141536 RepID=UPI0031CCF0A5